MKRLFLMLALALGAPALAADVDAKSVRMWNPATVTTVAGTVEAIERVEMGGGLTCVRLRLATGSGVLQVRVGPDWWVAEQKLTFAKGDRVEVKGSRLTFAGEASMVAGEIVRGAERFALRDADGKPAWGGK